jgi:nucleoside-diphosphate-sugar epimerase
LQDEVVQRQLVKADAVIDVECPFTFPRKKVQVARLRPSLLRKALEGSGRALIVTGDAAILGDTGPVPVSENAALRPLSGYVWLPRLEQEILKSPGVRGIIIRPAWEVHGSKPSRLSSGLGNWITLARRFRRGKYIGSGENRCSAVHFDDLADLYSIALKRARAGTSLHASSENFSIKDLAAIIHRGLGFKGALEYFAQRGSTLFSNG